MLVDAQQSPRVSERWLRDRFAAPRRVEPVTIGDGHLFRAEGEIRPAAVLVPVVRRDDELTVLFTRRTSHLHDHAGQISFPGGRAEPDDASPRETALRETAEEIGLAPARSRSSAPHRLHDGHGLPRHAGRRARRAPLRAELDDFEVAEVFEVPLAFLLDPANHQRNLLMHDGLERHYYAMPYGPYYIWGATAGMLMNFYAYLTAPH